MVTSREIKAKNMHLLPTGRRKEGKMLSFNDVEQIDIRLLHHHPGNPRKDLGDLEELSESIKKQGVMQNLTIIPADYWNDVDVDENKMQDAICNALNENYETPEDPNLPWFLVLIGNRRLEAAKAAGITRLPCKIVTGLSKEEQVSIMLLENIQRNDLTIQEQAKGFQMMIDLGDTPDGISSKTGLSKATVYHRLNIAKLDEKILDDAVNDHQITLTELTELEKLDDIEARNKILKNHYNNIQWAVKNELDRIEKENQKQAIISKLNENFALEKLPSDAQTWRADWKNVGMFKFEDEEIDMSDLPKDTLYYTEYYEGIKVYTHDETVAEKENQRTEESEEEKSRSSKINHLSELWEIFKSKIRDYIIYLIKDYKPTADEDELISIWWEFIIYHNIDIDSIPETIGEYIESAYPEFADEFAEKNDPEADDYEELYEAEIEQKARGLRFDYQAIILIFNYMETYKRFVGWQGEYQEDKAEEWNIFLENLHSYYDFGGSDLDYKFFDDIELNKLLSGEHEFYEKKGGAS